jgi:hypothetical protein
VRWALCVSQVLAKEGKEGTALGQAEMEANKAHIGPGFWVWGRASVQKTKQQHRAFTEGGIAGVCCIRNNAEDAGCV